MFLKLTKSGRSVLAVAVALLKVASAEASCYTVYKGNSRVYHAMSAPVDISLPYSATVPAKFGVGAMMIVTPDAFDCPGGNILRGADAEAYGQTSRDDGAASTASALNALAERHSVGFGEDAPSEGLVGGSYGSGSNSPRGPILTGPRGGKYFVNGSGNRSYVGSRGGGRR